ncbi:MAG: response regulator [Pseudomonadota bacterium]
MTPGKQAEILIVDDDSRNRQLISVMLEAEGYKVVEAASGQAALEQVARQSPDLVLLDIMMPGMDGYEVASRIKQNPATQSIPIIMITALEDSNSKLRALNLGAEEFLTKPVNRAELWVRVRNLLRLKEYGDFLKHHNRILEEQVAQRTSQLQQSYIQTLRVLGVAAEYKDEETGNHIQRIAEYSLHLSERLGMDGDFCDTIHHASPMHDIGKIGIPDAVLLKPGKLLDHEWDIMRTHCEIGASILRRGESPYLGMASDIALSHHERWDGSGYPQGLAGEAIPLPARIMAICDVYDALRSKRPYKPALEHEKSLEIILTGDGRTQPGHFDPAILDAFRRSADTFREIYAGRED